MPDATYCERLGIERPDIGVMAAALSATPLQWLVLVLLEHGAPMDLEEVALRPWEVGPDAPSGDWLLSLKRAWAGRAPVVRDPDDKADLDVDAWQLRAMLRDLGLLPNPPPRVRPTPLLPDSPTDQPLDRVEVEAAFGGRSLFGLSPSVVVGAVLDAHGGEPLSADEANAVLAALSAHFYKVVSTNVRLWRSGLVRLDEGGRLALDRRSPALATMRAKVRALARRELERRERNRLSVIAREKYRREDAARRVRDREQARGLRRVVLHAAMRAGAPAAVVLVSMEDRSIRFFEGGELGGLATALDAHDIVGGLDIRRVVGAAGGDLRSLRLVDLGPPRKSRRLNRQGRSLRITPEMVIRSTTGISRPLGDRAKVRRDLDAGRLEKVERRLASDAKAFAATWRYALLHGFVRLRWGFLDEILPSAWGEPGDVRDHDLYEDALTRGVPLDVVVGSAPDWADPWSRAERGWVLGWGPWHVDLRFGGEVRRLPRIEVQAIRLSEDTACP